MITRDEMMGVLLEACPSFRPVWDAFVAEWESEGPDLPLYVALAGFARHLVAMLERADTASFPQIFAAVERLHLEGDAYVREAATVGLLEDLQNGNLHTATEPEQFRAFLLPESERWWDELYRFWGRVQSARRGGPWGVHRRRGSSIRGGSPARRSASGRRRSS